MKRKTTKQDLKDMSHPANAAAAEAFTPWRQGPRPDTSAARELTQPPIVKVADMPLNSHIDGVITDVIPSQQKKIRNPLVLMELTEGDGNKISMPCVAALERVLLPEYDSDNSAHVAEPQKYCPYIGKRVVITKTAIKKSKTWTEDDGKTPRSFPVFDVSVFGAEDVPAADGAKKRRRR